MGFIFFRNQFVTDDNAFNCQSMLMCFVAVVNDGYVPYYSPSVTRGAYSSSFALLSIRNGAGVGDLLRDPVWEDPQTPWRIIYDLSFFFLVIVILLNIIFGIIIDTFGGTKLFIILLYSFFIGKFIVLHIFRTASPKSGD